MQSQGQRQNLLAKFRIALYTFFERDQPMKLIKKSPRNTLTFLSDPSLRILLFLSGLGQITQVKAQETKPVESGLQAIHQSIQLSIPKPTWKIVDSLKVEKNNPLAKPSTKGLRISDTFNFQLSLGSAAMAGSKIVLSDLKIDLALASAIFEQKPIIRVDCGALAAQFRFPVLQISLPREISVKVLKKDSSLWAQHLIPNADLKKLLIDELMVHLSGPQLAQNLQLQAQCSSPHVTELLRAAIRGLLAQWDIRKEFEASADLDNEINKLQLVKLPEQLQKYSSFIPDDFSATFNIQVFEDHWKVESTGLGQRELQKFNPSPKVIERIQTALSSAKEAKNYGLFLSNSNLSWILEQSLANLAKNQEISFRTLPTEENQGLAYEWTLPSEFEVSTLKSQLTELETLPGDKKLKARLRTIGANGKPAALNLFPWVSANGLKRGWEISGPVVIDFLDAQNAEVLVTYFVGNMTWALEHIENKETGETHLKYLEADIVQDEEISQEDLKIPGAHLLPKIWVHSLNFLINRDTQVDLVNEKYLSEYGFVVPKNLKLTWMGQATRSSRRPLGGGFRAQGISIEIPSSDSK